MARSVPPAFGVPALVGAAAALTVVGLALAAFAVVPVVAAAAGADVGAAGAAAVPQAASKAALEPAPMSCSARRRLTVSSASWPIMQASRTYFRSYMARQRSGYAAGGVDLAG